MAEWVETAVAAPISKTCDQRQSANHLDLEATALRMIWPLADADSNADLILVSSSIFL